MLFFYIRHGDPTYNPDALTPLGRRQAEALSRRLCTYGVDKIYSSTSTRAIETATPTAEILKLPIGQFEWAHENLSYRAMHVKNEKGERTWIFAAPKYKELFNSPAMRALGERWTEHEAIRDTAIPAHIEYIARETDAFFETLGYRHDRENARFLPIHPTEERVAFFAHQGFGMLFLSQILDLPYPQFATRHNISHTGMTVINFRETDGVVYPQMLELSNDSHLWRDGLPTFYNNTYRF